MTRINLVPPSELCDQHLLAEYRELPRAFTLAKVAKLPEKFKLGTGHVKFFYNKLFYLLRRYNQIVRELRSRGFNLDYQLIANVERSARAKLFSDVWFRSTYYTPTKQDLKLIRRRLKVKMPAKPRFTKPIKL